VAPRVEVAFALGQLCKQVDLAITLSPDLAVDARDPVGKASCSGKSGRLSAVRDIEMPVDEVRTRPRARDADDAGCRRELPATIWAMS